MAQCNGFNDRLPVGPARTYIRKLIKIILMRNAAKLIIKSNERRVYEGIKQS